MEHRELDPDLSVAVNRGPRNFDGNAQRRITGWFYAYTDRFEAEDFVVMGESEALDWVIFPLVGPV